MILNFLAAHRREISTICDPIFVCPHSHLKIKKVYFFLRVLIKFVKRSLLVFVKFQAGGKVLRL